MAGRTNQINLASLFKNVASSLSEQKETLNKADTYNHDHGDNMVEIFTVISQAMQAKRNASPADQLEYASQLLRQKAKWLSPGICRRVYPRLLNSFKEQRR